MPITEPLRRIYWRDTEPVLPGPPLRGEVEADVVFVGGGYTALWSARALLERDRGLRVHILEREYAGAGGSGHNDGFVTPTIGHSLHSAVRAYGVEHARIAYQEVGRAILDIRRFCRREASEANLAPGGFLLVATTDEQRRRLEADARMAERLGARYDLLETAEVQERVASPAIRAALRCPGGVVNPHRLARALFRGVVNRGGVVHEQTEALQIGRDGPRFAIRTSEGLVRADRVVLATNAYQHQFAPLRTAVKPIWSYALVTERLTDEQLARVHWPAREGFVEARNFILFARQTADQRLLIGGGRAIYRRGGDMSDRFIHDASVERELRAALARYFPVWSDLPIAYSYGGCIAMTLDLVPHVGASPDGILYAHGYNGNGITMTKVFGDILATLAVGERPTDAQQVFLDGPRRRFPRSELLVRSGARLASGTLALQDRRPDLVPVTLI